MEKMIKEGFRSPTIQFFWIIVPSIQCLSFTVHNEFDIRGLFNINIDLLKGKSVSGITRRLGRG